MKKITFIFVFIFLLIIQIPLFVQYNVAELEGSLNKQCAFMDIKSTGGMKVEEFARAVQEFTKQEHAFVATMSYKAQADKQELTQLFLAGENPPSSLKAKGITKKTLRRVTGEGKALTGREAGFRLFNPQKDAAVHPFSDLMGNSLSRTYYVYPQSAGAAFQKYMTEEYDVTFFDSGELLYLQSEYMSQLPGITLLAAALLVFWAFWVVSEYQLNAVKKLHGYSDTQCRRSLFAKLFTVMGSAFLLSLLCGLVFCGIYNRWINYGGLLMDIGKICLPVMLAVLAAAWLFLALFYSSDVKYALKGKKPYPLLLTCAAILKGITIVFLCYAVSSLGQGSQQARKILQQEKDFAPLSSCRFTEFRLAGGASDYLTEIERKGNDLYHALDGILMDNREIWIGHGFTSPPEQKMSLWENPRSNMVHINPAYLQVNPILDLEGNPVQFREDQIASNEAVILVPEQYRPQEKELYSALDKWYHSSRYVTAPDHHLDIKDDSTKIRLCYVKDNQTYFAFDTEVSAMNLNYIKDPFAVLVTRNNMDPSMYSNFIITGKYFLFQNEHQTVDDILNAAKKAGLDQELSNVPTVESSMDSLMQECRTQVIMAAVVLALSILTVALVCVYIVKNYMEQNRRLFFVKKMLGYPPGKIYGGFIFVSALVEVLVFIALKLALTMDTSVWLATFASFMGADFVLMWLVALIYQKTLTKNALKGDGI